MNERHYIFLDILRTELARSIIPNLSEDIPLRMATLAVEQLKRFQQIVIQMAQGRLQ